MAYSSSSKVVTCIAASCSAKSLASSSLSPMALAFLAASFNFLLSAVNCCCNASFSAYQRHKANDNKTLLQNIRIRGSCTFWFYSLEQCMKPKESALWCTKWKSKCIIKIWSFEHQQKFIWRLMSEYNFTIK